MTERKLKHLSELLREVQENDIVQFYTQKDCLGNRLKKPEEIYAGYYKGYFQEGDKIAVSTRLSGGTSSYFYFTAGIRFAPNSDMQKAFNEREISHYLILQRSEQARGDLQ